jgi:hypothetical protein
MWFRSMLCRPDPVAALARPARRGAVPGPASCPALLETLEGRRLLCGGGVGDDYSAFAPDEAAAQVARPAKSRSQLKAESLAHKADKRARRAARSSAATPSLSISDVSRAEDNSGLTTFAFTVSLSKASRTPVRVDFATVDGTATAAGGDYERASGRLKFSPGQTTKTVTVQVRGDNLPEPDETFFVNVSRAENAVIADAQGVGMILNDDAPEEIPDPSISIGDFWLEEGNDALRSLVLTVSLSAPSTKPVSVDYATENGTALAGDNDYQPASGTVTFAPGETAKSITLLTYTDTMVEADEVYFVKLSRPLNAVIADGVGTVTIANDDGLPPPPDDGGGGDCTADHPYYPNC